MLTLFLTYMNQLQSSLIMLNLYFLCMTADVKATYKSERHLYISMIYTFLYFLQYCYCIGLGVGSDNPQAHFNVKEIYMFLTSK